MVGGNCGAEWTVTWQSTKANDSNTAAGVKIEQYGSGGAAQPGGYNASAGSGPGEYRAGAGAQRDYKG